MSLLRSRLILRSRQTNSLLRRRYSQYNYTNSYPPPVNKTSWGKKLLYVTAGLGIVTGYAYYMWWPKHTFPSSVAKILRQGLWAESDKGEFDYQLALKHYLEALEHAQEIGLDPLSDEYTGIQLKIGEMFERLNMLADAAYIYNEIATLYLTVLTASPQSEDGLKIKDRKHKRHLIQKDLRIALKLVSLNTSNPALAKAILITHLIIAQDEVNKLMGPTPGKLNLINKIKPDGAQQQQPGESYTAVLENDEIVITNTVTGEESRIKKTPEVWEPFTDEFFNAMDLLSAVCISAGDLTMATKVKIAMNESMLLADIEPSKMLLSQCNLGSLLYMQAEELEAQEIGLKRRISDLSGIKYEDLNTDQDILAQNQLQETVPIQDQEAFRNVVKSREVCLKLAVKSYESVLQFAKSFPQDFIKQHKEISETVAIATYGLGVINLHLSQYDKAERFLRESRVRARNCNYDTLFPMIEKELEKLFNEKKLVKSNAPVRRDIPEIEMDITLK